MRGDANQGRKKGSNGAGKKGWEKGVRLGKRGWEKGVKRKI